jgi:hypothetical protein
MIKPDGTGLKNITIDTMENYSTAWSSDGVIYPIMISGSSTSKPLKNKG